MVFPFLPPIPEEYANFISQHASDDPRQLMLKAKHWPHLDIPFIASQLICRKKAKTKLPSWHDNPQIVFPSELALEQASSEKAAIYKAIIMKGGRGVDLTGGMGVDSFFWSKNLDKLDVVEPNQSLLEVTSANHGLLGGNGIRYHAKTAEEFVEELTETVDTIYIDPSRRNESENKVWEFADCTPNILLLKDALLSKSKRVFVKASPMIDLKLAIRQLGNVASIRCISIQNECKEILFELTSTATNLQMIGVELIATQNELLKYESWEEEKAPVTFSAPMKYLYEPHVSLLKLGAYKIISARYGLSKLHPNTHLYTSDRPIDGFPGRSFKIMGIAPLDKKKLAAHIPSLQANITVRNFPLTVQQIRQKTGIKDGGQQYLFATTLLNENKVVLITEKAQ